MLFKPFGKNDTRLKVALDKCEPLIHFALNCGAKSCPPIKTFSAKGIRNELKVSILCSSTRLNNDNERQVAVEAFLETDDAVTIDTDKNQIKLSQILKWYSVDFGANEVEVGWKISFYKVLDN